MMSQQLHMRMGMPGQLPFPFFSGFPMPQLSPQISPIESPQTVQTPPQLTLPMSSLSPVLPQFSPEMMQLMFQQQLPYPPQQIPQLQSVQRLEVNQNKSPKIRQERKQRKQEQKRTQQQEHQRLPAQPPPQQQQQQQQQQQPVNPQAAEIPQQVPLEGLSQEQLLELFENKKPELIDLFLQFQKQQEIQKILEPTVQTQGFREPENIGKIKGEMNGIVLKLYKTTGDMKKLMEKRAKKLSKQSAVDIQRSQMQFPAYEYCLKCYSANLFIVHHLGKENMLEYQRKLEAEIMQVKVELYGAGHPLVLERPQLQPETSQSSTSAQSSSQSSPNQHPPVLEPQVPIGKISKKSKEEGRQSKSDSRQSTPKQSRKRASPPIPSSPELELPNQEVMRRLDELLKNKPCTSQQAAVVTEYARKQQELYDILDELLLKTNDPLRNHVRKTQELTAFEGFQIVQRLNARFIDNSVPTLDPSGNLNKGQNQMPIVSISDLRLALPDTPEELVRTLLTWLVDLCAQHLRSTPTEFPTIQPTTSTKTSKDSPPGAIVNEIGNRLYQEETAKRIKQNAARDNEPSTSAAWESVEQQPDVDNQISQKPKALVGSKKRKSDHRIEESVSTEESMNRESVIRAPIEDVGDNQNEEEDIEIPKKKARVESSVNQTQPISLSTSSCIPLQAHVDNQMESTPAVQVSPVGIEKEDDGTHMKENQRNRSDSSLNGKTPSENHENASDESSLKTQKDSEIPMEMETSQNNNTTERTQPAPVFIEKIPVERMAEIHFANIEDTVVASKNDSANNNNNNNNIEMKTEAALNIDLNEIPLPKAPQPARNASIETIDLSEDDDDNDCVITGVLEGQTPSTSSQTPVSPLEMLARISIMMQSGIQSPATL